MFAPAADLRICNVSLGETLADENARTVLKITHMSPTVPEEDEDEDEDDDEEDNVPMKECEVVLCALTPGKVRPTRSDALRSRSSHSLQIEQAVVDLILQEEQSVAIEAIGKKYVLCCHIFCVLLIVCSQRDPPRRQLHRYAPQY